jgi:riboflavin kinase
MKKRLLITYLIDLLKLGAGDRLVKAPTIYISHIFGLSQQSTSRVLTELSDLGYIHKEIRDGTVWVILTDRAMEELEMFFKYIDGARKYPGEFIFEGEIVKGLGEGAYYMSKPGYKRQFYRTLGYEPYPGTLNVKLSEPLMITQNKVLRKMKGIYIKGFRDESRTFGSVQVYPAIIMEKLEGAVLYARRTIYGPDIIELISEYYIKGELGLKDGDIIRFKVKLSENY